MKANMGSNGSIHFPNLHVLLIAIQMMVLFISAIVESMLAVGKV